MPLVHSRGRWLLAAGLLAAAALAGCASPGSTSPVTPPAGTGGATASETASPSAVAPSQSVAPTVAPPTLPAGFPVMPGALADDPPAHADAAASWHTEALGPDVYEWYAARLPEAGFPIQGLYPGGSVAVILFVTPSGETLQLALVSSDAGTAFQVAAAER